MKQLQTLSLIVIIIALVSAGCKKFKTDDEIRENIVGTWVRTDCGWMDSDDFEVDQQYSLLRDTLVFRANGAFDEFDRYDYCCSNECDTAFPGSGRCNWKIEDGVMTIVPDSVVNLTHLNQPYPIRRHTNKTLVFDNVVIGNLERKKTCYCRD